MNTLQIKSDSYIGSVIDYTPPRLHVGNDWYVDFYSYDPAQKKKRRKKYKLNYIEKIGDRRRYAANLIKKLHQKLEDGWNPWIESENERAYHTFKDVCDHYRRYITKLEADGILRPDTYRDYTSQLRNIEEWNTGKKSPIVYIYQFDRMFIVDLLEYMYIGRGNSAVTRNNYLTFARGFCNFLLNHQYVKDNPSEGIAFISKSKMKKIRTVIEEADIIKLCEYLDKNNKHFLLACYILHYCFVRPKEMSYIQLKHINLNKQTLYIPGEISKNGNNEIVTLPIKVIHLMLELEVFKSAK